MKQPNGSYILLSLVYVLTPPVVLTLVGLLAYSQSVDVSAAVIANTLPPTVGASFLAALIGWALFLCSPKQIADGKKAGILTIFLSYLFCPMPLAYEAGNWDGLLGIGTNYLTFFVIGQILTFWITYPIGASFGHLIAKRML